MSISKQFATNKNLETQGIVLDYGVNEDDNSPIQITIARAGGANESFQKLVTAKTKPYQRAMQTDTMNPDVLRRITKEVYATTVVLGWTGIRLAVLDKDGLPTDKEEDVQFSFENCIRLFDQLPDLYTDILQQAQNASLFRQSILENAAKN